MKNFYLSVLVCLLLVITASCGCIRTKPTKTLNFETCQTDCIIEGFDNGTCLSYFETTGDLYDIGNCVIEGSSNCNKKGQCHCYCLYQEKDDLDFLLDDLKKQTNINFEEIQVTEMEWQSEYGKLLLSGKGFRALQVSSQEIEIIQEYFNENSFEINKINTNAGRITDLYGYVKNDISCLVSLSAVLDESDQPVEEDINILKIKCAKTNN